ncbi:hypothetical protein D3C78_1552520 [compost metagenome]
MHFHDIDDGAAHFFAHLTKITIQLAHLQTKTAFDDRLQAAVALCIVRIEHGHHLVLIRQNQPLGVSHFHFIVLSSAN